MNKSPPKLTNTTSTARQTYPCPNFMPPFSPKAASWNEAIKQHENNYLVVIKNCYPITEWIRRLFGNKVGNEIPIEDEETKYGLKLSIAEMHRMYMRALQIELVNIGVGLQFNSSDDKMRENFGPAMMAYTQAIRDYEYMMTGSRGYDYFVVSYERANDKIVLRRAVNPYHEKKLALYVEKRNTALANGSWEKGEVANPIGLVRRENEKTVVRRAFWWRLGGAIVGAGFLVGPMWLLALKKGLYLQLEATTGFVFGFGLTMAYFVDRVDQVFAGTLAYAAVLMVFVGLSIQGAEDK